MGCSMCDYDPCMCGKHDYSDEPASVCNICDCNPCMCGKNDYRSENQVREDRERENENPNFRISDGE